MINSFLFSLLDNKNTNKPKVKLNPSRDCYYCKEKTTSITIINRIPLCEKCSGICERCGLYGPKNNFKICMECKHKICLACCWSDVCACCKDKLKLSNVCSCYSDKCKAKCKDCLRKNPNVN